MNWAFVLIPIALAAVAIVLFAGILNLARGGSPERSQILMRWRVILQFIAVALMMIALYFAAR